jgi:hypothetical protein
VGAIDGAVEAPEVAFDEAGLVQSQQQGVEDFGPRAILAPAVEAVVDGLPGAVTLGGIGPRSAAVQVPEDAVDETAMVLPGMAAVAVVVAVGEEVGNTLPLGVRKVIAIGHGWPPFGNLPARGMGSLPR